MEEEDEYPLLPLDAVEEDDGEDCGAAAAAATTDSMSAGVTGKSSGLWARGSVDDDEEEEEDGNPLSDCVPFPMRRAREAKAAGCTGQSSSVLLRPPREEERNSRSAKRISTLRGTPLLLLLPRSLFKLALLLLLGKDENSDDESPNPLWTRAESLAKA